jgi:hypothetical protein
MLKRILQPELVGIQQFRGISSDFQCQSLPKQESEKASFLRQFALIVALLIMGSSLSLAAFICFLGQQS